MTKTKSQTKTKSKPDDVSQETWDLKMKLESIIGKEIPDDVSMPSPIPKDEKEWWMFMEQTGELQWRINHDLADRRPWTDPSRDNEALDEIGRILIFWGAAVADMFGLILPEQCPKGNKSYRAGETVADIACGIIGVEKGTVIPQPPEGKKWWWDWYQEMKEGNEPRPTPPPDPNAPGNRKLKL